MPLRIKKFICYLSEMISHVDAASEMLAISSHMNVRDQSPTIRVLVAALCKEVAADEETGACSECACEKTAA